MADINLLLEAEKRGIIDERNQALLEEARKRGLVPSAETASPQDIQEEVPQDQIEAPVQEGQELLPGEVEPPPIEPVEASPLARFFAPRKSSIDEGDELASPLGEIEPGESGVTMPEAIVQGVINIPSTAPEYAGSIWEGVKALSPLKTEEGKRPLVETAKGVGNIIAGSVQRLFPGEQGKEQFSRAFTGFLNERYGNFERFKVSLAERPLEVASDFSAFLGGLGAGTSVLGKLATATKGAKAASKANVLTQLGGELMRIADGADPARLITRAGQKAFSESSKKALVKNAFDFKNSLPIERIEEAANFALANGILPTKAGLEKVRSIQRTLRKQVDNIIRNDKGFIFTQDLVKTLDDFIGDQAARNAAGVGDSASLNMMERMRNDLLKQNGMFMSMEDLQALKQGLNKDFVQELGTRFGRVKNKTNEIVRIQAKNILEQRNPELANANPAWKVSIDLEEAIESVVNKATKRGGAVGSKGLLTGVLAAGAVGATTQDLGTAAMVAAAALAIDRVIDNPTVKVKLAQVLRRVGKTGKAGSSFFGKLAPPAFQIGRAQEQELLQPMPQGAQSALTNNIQGVLRGQ